MKARYCSLALALFVGMAVTTFASPDCCNEIPEPLLGAELNSDKIRITVAQSGGTDRNSFKFDVQKDGSEQFLTIVRIKSDNCKMMPQRETFDFTLAEVGIDAKKPVFITNTFFCDEIFADMKQHELERAASEAGKTDKKAVGTDAAASFKERARAAFEKIGARPAAEPKN